MSTADWKKVYWSEIRRPYDHRRAEQAIEIAAKLQKSAHDRIAELMEVEQWKRKQRVIFPK